MAATLARAQSVSFNVQSLGSPDASAIVFTPDGGNLSVSFQTNSAAEAFAISGSSVANLDSLTGTITGNFTISGFTYSPTLEQGTVSSSANASLVISDGAGDTETAHLWWNSAYTAFSGGSISSFDMNAGVSPNLSQFTYSGSANSALAQDFAGITSGDAIISFSFASAPDSLTELAAASGPTADSFSGQVSEIPEPDRYAAVLAAGVLAATAGRRAARRRAA